jgi:hypothetical protein
MPVHDWTRVDAGIFHDFHHAWIEEIKRALNRDRLPEGYYALAEQFAAGLGPDVLTLQGSGNGDDGEGPRRSSPAGGVSLLSAPQLQPTAETDREFYLRKHNVIAVRHVSGDRVVAMIEIVSPGNKAARNPLRAFVAKAAELLSKGVHLLVIDVFSPGRRDPEGIHSEIWQEIAGQEYEPPPEDPLAVAAYDAGIPLRAYVRHFAEGKAIPDMPLFLEPGLAIMVPLEATYNAAYAEVPRRWRRVLETPAK